MPLYEYQCKKCEQKFEALVSFKNADNSVKCPNCDSDETSRLLSTFACKGNNVSSSASNSSCNSGGT